MAVEQRFFREKHVPPTPADMIPPQKDGLLHRIGGRVERATDRLRRIGIVPENSSLFYAHVFRDDKAAERHPDPEQKFIQEILSWKPGGEAPEGTIVDGDSNVLTILDSPPIDPSPDALERLEEKLQGNDHGEPTDSLKDTPSFGTISFLDSDTFQ